MKIFAPAIQSVLFANGTATGYVTLTSDAGFYVGAECWLSNNAGQQRCTITELAGSNVVGIRFLEEENRGAAYPKPHYGRNSCAAYTTATSSKLSQPAQYVTVDPAFTRPTGIAG